MFFCWNALLYHFSFWILYWVNSLNGPINVEIWINISGQFMDKQRQFGIMIEEINNMHTRTDLFLSISISLSVLIIANTTKNEINI
jgi:hypothetical protein